MINVHLPSEFSNFRVVFESQIPCLSFAQKDAYHKRNISYFLHADIACVNPLICIFVFLNHKRGNIV